MNSSRRQTLQAAGGVGLYGALVAIGMLPATGALAQQKFDATAFFGKNVPDTLKALGAAGGQTSSEIAIIAPDIAENGAVVPVGASTALPGVKRLALLVEKNPSALAAVFRWKYS